ncbi:MAG: hypothetical protein ACREL9_14175 [Gemmatimonadales bacterium]
MGAAIEPPPDPSGIAWSQPAALTALAESQSSGGPSGNSWPPSASAAMNLRGIVVIWR